MKFVCFYHSLASDWNHGNAHFLRGVVSELRARGHEVVVYEQADNWSRWNLRRDHGEKAEQAYHAAYPLLKGVERMYALPPEGVQSAEELAELIGLDAMLRDADVVLVHEWSPPALVEAVGRHRKRNDHYRLLFHDTHHRVVSAPQEMERFELSGYDGVLAFGQVLSDAYARRGWDRRVWTWHEAADTRLFRPLDRGKTGDLVWIGNWGDDERTAELHEFLLGPVRRLGLDATVHGVRYPEDALSALKKAGITYGGWIANYEAPELLARHRVTIHVPRRYYVTHLPGIPTIRPFEALACGIPLICSPWDDAEDLFRPGIDYLLAADGREMQKQLEFLLESPSAREDLAGRGLETIRRRHTCAHRVDELFGVLDEVSTGQGPAPKARKVG